MGFLAFPNLRELLALPGLLLKELCRLRPAHLGSPRPISDLDRKPFH